MPAVKRLTIAICCALFYRYASSSVTVDKIVPNECTQVLRIAVTLKGKPQDFGQPSYRLKRLKTGLTSCELLCRSRPQRNRNHIRECAVTKDWPLTAHFHA
jgi:hypothetical protein